MLTRLASFLLVLSVGFAMAGEPLSVMSFNIRGDFDNGVATDKPTGWLSKKGKHRRDLVLRLVEDADLDLLGVQEAYRNQVEEIDAALDGHDAYGVGRDDGAQAGEHCTIYYRRSRFERLDAGTFWLSNTPETPSTYPGAACPRVASWVSLRDKELDRELLVVNTHWDHVSAEARAHSASLIRDRVESLRRGRPAIVMGDLNVGEAMPPIKTLLGAGNDRLIDAYRTRFPKRSSRERTHHAFRGTEEGVRIDYVLHTPDLRATEAEIDRQNREGVFPSDHFPVTATLVPADRSQAVRATTR